MQSVLFTGIQVGALALRNRIVRSATYEGAAGADGVPGEAYVRMYEELGAGQIGLIITGFVAVSREGRAMQPRQAGLYEESSVPAFRRATDAAHRGGTPVVVQLAHAGRQTRRAVTGSRPLAPTRRRSPYFREKPRLLTHADALAIARQFVRSAVLAQRAGFDGVQLHAAHGYLLHQMLHPGINSLSNEFGIDVRTGIGTALTARIIDGIRASCGADFPVLVKISGDTDLDNVFSPERFDALISWLHGQRVAAIEISYGTMDHALNIFRGGVPFALALEHNPLLQSRLSVLRELKAWYFRQRIIPAFKPFTPLYNLDYAARAKTLTDIPVITVGGVRTRREMETVVAGGKADLVAMSRPFLREPDLVRRMLHAGADYASPCTNCNQCVIMCDADRPTSCYHRTPNSSEG